MKHKIIINTLSLLSSITGIGRYTYEISKEIKNSRDFSANFYYGYLSKNLLEPTQKVATKSIKSIVTSNWLIKRVARWIIDIKTLFLPKYDIYWEPNFIPFKYIKAKKVVISVHDFSFILYKEYHPKERVKYFEQHFFKRIKRSDIIITGSNFTKQEIIDRLKIDANRVKVIYHGINHNQFKVLKKSNINMRLPKKFILSVGSIEPRKNLLGLLKSYDLLSIDLKKEYKLVLVGFKGWNNKDIIKIINKNKNYIQYLGYLSEEDLVKAYNLASLFVYPSFYEGFGLPPLEAMACGTPVVTSNVSSLPEVGGDAVVYCNPYDINDIKEKIEMVLNNETLQQQMIEKGLQRAKKFTWEQSANEHMKVFKEVLEI